MNFKLNMNNLYSQRYNERDLIFDNTDENKKKIMEYQNQLLKYSENIFNINEESINKKNPLI